jgi:hypothetical protein
LLANITFAIVEKKYIFFTFLIHESYMINIQSILRVCYFSIEFLWLCFLISKSGPLLNCKGPINFYLVMVLMHCKWYWSLYNVVYHYEIFYVFIKKTCLIKPIYDYFLYRNDNILWSYLYVAFCFDLCIAEYLNHIHDLEV